ncbi:MAG: aspartate--tRNA ligase [bacterium]
MKRLLTSEIVDKAGRDVLLKGWVHRRRNMGKIAFIDLRDRAGLVQVVFSPSDLDQESLTALEKLRPEFVIAVEGKVNQRPEAQINRQLPTGSIEVLAKKLIIISSAKTPPFEIENENIQANEELRLKYRYLDLRHDRLRKNIELSYQTAKFIRQYLDKKDFIEIETPLLTKSTPEGARDFLVPSRQQPGKFYALPQSPQQYKQLLMVAGFEKYFQIAPCFRDEDARADRSPGEFYQLDLEMSFVSQKEILSLMEKMLTVLVKKVAPDKKISQTSWPRLTYEEAMKNYGTDKPDLRKDKNDPDELAFCWVIDFPLFEKEKVAGHFAPSHHMFTAPKEKHLHFLAKHPEKAKSYQHDLTLNGYEIAGGSIRIHQPEIQRQIFDLIGFTDKQKEYFNHMLEAFEYGVPPHGGIALGIARLVMLLAGEPNLREVIAFPKSADGKDLVTGAPAEAEESQLAELGIAFKEQIK